MSNVVKISDYRNKGNGAREAVSSAFKIDWFVCSKEQRFLVDHFLAALWMEGFKVVPLEPKDSLP